MVFKIIGIIFLMILLFTDIKQIIKKIEQFVNKKIK
uniref:Orf32 n=2 Tax=Phytophthora TaxID=4783 RepID=A0A455L7S6_9STRA|nr:orf32 [Phytophthora humicola]AXU39104.1 orf32 [Phytophthora humicola x Phytophthora inundata]